jgi:tetratricopeptide (TPR) repeat protein
LEKAVKEESMFKLIQVRYRNNREGLIDDVTLKELIRERKIKQFFRPSESRWVDVEKDPVRVKSNGFMGPERRVALRPTKKEKPPGLISKLLRRKTHEKLTSAEEWFEKGFVLLHTTDQYQEAVRAFASAIALNPGDARAYLNRGMAFERLDNIEQAIADYSCALELSPRDAKILYILGITFWRQNRTEEALKDIRAAAELGYLSARNFLKAKKLDA